MLQFGNIVFLLLFFRMYTTNTTGLCWTRKRITGIFDKEQATSLQPLNWVYLDHTSLFHPINHNFMFSHKFTVYKYSDKCIQCFQKTPSHFCNLLSEKLTPAINQFCCQSFHLKINVTWGKYRGCFRYTVYENERCLTAILTFSKKIITRVVDTLQKSVGPLHSKCLSLGQIQVSGIYPTTSHPTQGGCMPIETLQRTADK